MFQLAKDGKEFGLSFTHEEIVMDILRKRSLSYKDLPLGLYQFSSKFRNEARSRSGLLRGIEFGMKDLYSAHASEEDMRELLKTGENAFFLIRQKIVEKTAELRGHNSGGLADDGWS